MEIIESNKELITVLENLILNKTPEDQAWFKWCLDVNLLCYYRGELVPNKNRCQKLLFKLLDIKIEKRKEEE